MHIKAKIVREFQFKTQTASKTFSAKSKQVGIPLFASEASFGTEATYRKIAFIFDKSHCTYLDVFSREYPKPATRKMIPF